MHGDAVLDPAMLQERGVKIGAEVRTVDGGLHDLILSLPAPRRQAYDYIFDFIRTH